MKRCGISFATPAMYCFALLHAQPNLEATQTEMYILSSGIFVSDKTFDITCSVVQQKKCYYYPIPTADTGI